MQPQYLSFAFAAFGTLLLPGAVLAHDDDDSRILRGLTAPQYHLFVEDRDDDDRLWANGYRILHNDDDDDGDDRWEDDDDD